MNLLVEDDLRSDRGDVDIEGLSELSIDVELARPLCPANRIVMKVDGRIESVVLRDACRTLTFDESLICECDTGLESLTKGCR